MSAERSEALAYRLLYRDTQVSQHHMVLILAADAPAGDLLARGPEGQAQVSPPFPRPGDNANFPSTEAVGVS